MTKISRYFTLDEAVHSNTASRLGIANDPSAEEIANLQWTAIQLLDPIRERFGPIIINSGFRSQALNERTPGSSKTSAHVHGRAFDFRPADPSIGLSLIMAWVIGSPLPFDQIIYEYARWIHIGAPVACDPNRARRQALMKFTDEPYLSYNDNDRRVR